MSVALQKLDQYIDGVSIKQFETSLHEISDQIRIIDQKLITKTENEISIRYENQKYEISKIKNTFDQKR